MTVATLVLAAGRGERSGAALPKAYVSLCGKTLLERSIEALAAAPEVRWVVPVIAETDQSRLASLALDHVSKLSRPVFGGAERQDSVRAGLAALASIAPAAELVAVHDAARCLVRPHDISRVIAVAADTGAALLAHPVRDTLKRADAGVVIETLDRRTCWAAQTPQVFRIELLREAMEKADAEGFLGTDDAQLVERLGASVQIVEGPATNLKITLPEDFAIAQAWLVGREQETEA